MADIYREQRRYEEAIQLYQQLERVELITYGNDDIIVVKTRLNLIKAYQQQERDEEVTELLSKVEYSIENSDVGVFLIGPLQELSIIYIERGEFEYAFKMIWEQNIRWLATFLIFHLIGWRR